MQRFSRVVPDERHETVRVGLAFREPLRLAGFKSLFENIPNLMAVSGPIETLIADRSLGLLMVDLSPTSGLHPEWIRELRSVRKVRPDLPVLVVGADSDDGVVMEAILSGARAFLDWTANSLTIQQAISEVLRGEIWARRRVLSRLIDRLLRDAARRGVSPSEHSEDKPEERITDREQQVVELILEAQSNREIAHALKIEESTVKSHVANLMRKAGATNRVELSVWALQTIAKERDRAEGTASESRK